VEKPPYLHMRISPEHLRKLDGLRKRETDFPTRSDMVRRLIDRAADQQPYRPLRRGKGK